MYGRKKPVQSWPDSQVPKHRSSKDTKRWCRGVPGRAHRPEWRLSKFDRGISTRAPSSSEICTECRKELRYVWGWWTDKLGPAF